MDDIKKTHELIKSIYKNLLENFDLNVKHLLHSLKIIGKTQQNTCSYNKGFINCLVEFSNNAHIFQNTDEEIENGFKNISEVYNYMNENNMEINQQFINETIEPIRRKFHDDTRHVQIIFKKYLIGYEYHVTRLSNAHVIYQRNKERNKANKLEKDFLKNREAFEDFIIKNLKIAMLEAKNRYCYIINRLSKDLDNKVVNYKQIINKINNIKQSMSPAIYNNFSFENTSSSKHNSVVNLNRFDERVSTKSLEMKDSYWNKSLTLPKNKKYSLTGAETSNSNTCIIRLKADNVFIATNEYQLSIYPGDILLAEENSEYMGWIFGTNENKNYGWFPKNYTTVFEEESFDTLSKRLNRLEFLLVENNADKSEKNNKENFKFEDIDKMKYDSISHTFERKSLARKSFPEFYPPICPN